MLACVCAELSQMEVVRVEAPDSNIVLFHLAPEAPPVKVRWEPV